MSDTINIFVSSNITFEAFIRELEILLEIQLVSYTKGHNNWHEFLSPEVRIVVLAHELENDEDYDFADYPYQITIWGIEDRNVAERVRRREAYARSTFERLKSTQKYDLVMWDNLEVRLAEYHATE